MPEDEDSRKARAVSDFLQKSCRVRAARLLSFADFFRGLSYPVVHPVDRVKCKVFPVSTGSAAEFYIEPMLSCVGDTDVMYPYSNEIAIPALYSPPSQLPEEFESRVKVYKFVDSRMPGYVHLNLTFVLRKNMCDGHYTIVEYVSSPNRTLNHRLYVASKDGAKIHGPAYQIGFDENDFRNISSLFDDALPSISVMTDIVPCIHCPVWPPQASDWPMRHRHSGWPDAATVDRVVSQGCDVVGVAHHHCRQGEWMSKHQWRLSFSRAEVVLLNSWMPVQQIVYHMLRIFVKNKRLTDSAANSGADTLSNYHIKTLMLWACELKPRKWWNDGTTLVRKCEQVLQLLGKWLTKRHGQHYFINSVRFLDYIDKFFVETVLAMVRVTTAGSLAQWFIDNYIRKCAELCPGNTLLLCSELITSTISDDTVDAILRWRDHISNQTVLKQMLSLSMCCFAPLYICFQMAPVDMVALVQEQCQPITRSFPQINAHTRSYAMLPFMVKYMSLLGKSSAAPLLFPLLDILVHVMSVACSSADEKCKLHYLISNESRNLSHFQKAKNVMEIFANKPLDTYGLCQIELCRQFLRKACDDSEQQSVHSLAHMYLAVLQYTEGRYQKATDYCALVTRSDDQSQRRLHVVQGNLLPTIDDDIDSALGLVVFYQYVRSLALNQQQQRQVEEEKERYVNVFTMEMFAHYFSIKCLLVARCRLMPKPQEERSVQEAKFYLREEVKLLFNTLVSASHLLVSDLMLCKLPNNRIANTTYDFLSGSSSRRQLISFMTELSLEQLLKSRHLVLPRDAVSTAVCDISLTDFTALYLYRCQLYERCEQLCEQRIHDLIGVDSCSIPRVSTTYREFVQLIDDDVVSLIGLTVLLNEARTQSWYREHITITQLTLYLYLLIKCRTRIRLDMNHVTDTLSSLAVTLGWIAMAKKTISADKPVDHLILNLAERTTVIYIVDRIDKNKLTNGKEEHFLRIGLAVDLLKDVPQICSFAAIEVQQYLTSEIIFYKTYEIAYSIIS